MHYIICIIKNNLSKLTICVGWRNNEIAQISEIRSGSERKAALCSLLEEETSLLSTVERYRYLAGEQNMDNTIKSFVEKVSITIVPILGVQNNLGTSTTFCEIQASARTSNKNLILSFISRLHRQGNGEHQMGGQQPWTLHSHWEQESWETSTPVSVCRTWHKTRD